MLGRALKSDWIRMMTNLKFWLAIPAIAFLNWLTVADEWNLRGGKDSIVYYIVSKEGLGVFFILITLLAAWPFGGSFLEDKRSHSLPYYLQRGKRSWYCSSKIITAALGAFLCVFLGDCIAFGLLGTQGSFLLERDMTAQVFQNQRYYETMTKVSPVLYCIMEFSSEAAGYSFASIITFLVSVYTNNSFVVLTSPILFYYGSMMICQLLNLPSCLNWQNVRRNSALFMDCSNDFSIWGMTLGYFLIGTAVLGFLFYKLLKRRLERIV